MEQVRTGREKLSLFTGMICGFVVAALLTSLLAWYTYQGKAVAKVNGAAIRYHEFYRELARMQGHEVLDLLVERELVRAEAEKRGLKVEGGEVAARLREIQKFYGSEENFERLLQEKHLTLADVRNQIVFQLLAEKLVGEVKFEEEEAYAFYEQFKEARYDGQPYEKVRLRVKQDYETFLRGRLAPQTIQGLKEAAEIVYYW